MNAIGTDEKVEMDDRLGAVVGPEDGALLALHVDSNELGSEEDRHFEPVEGIE